MGKIYTAEYTILSIDNVYNDREEAKELQNLIQKNESNDCAKQAVLSKYSMEEIMAAYQFGGLKNVYHLLPKEYRNDQELTFIACLNGDDITSRSANLKRSYTLSCYLAHHILDSIDYISKEHLTRNDSYLLKEYAENHLDALNRIPKDLISKDIVLTSISYYRANQERNFGYFKYPEYLILSNIPDELKTDYDIIYKASRNNPILLFDMDPKCVAHSLAYNDEAFYKYMSYLTKKVRAIDEKINMYYSYPRKISLTDEEFTDLKCELRDILHRQMLLCQEKERAINKDINADIRRRNRTSKK